MTESGLTPAGPSPGDAPPDGIRALTGEINRTREDVGEIVAAFVAQADIKARVREEESEVADPPAFHGPRPGNAASRSAAADGAVVSLPRTFRDAVRAEFGRAFRPPYATLSTVAANGAFMSLAWFFLPRALKDDTFTLHGSLAFALVLAAWMYSDVPATNVLAPDRQRMTAAIDDPALLRRLLYAKNVVLWTFITPACAVIALVTGISGHDLLSTLYTVIWIGLVPFGVLGVSAWVGILFPYHPMPLRLRREHRRPRRRMLWRWLTLPLTPYVLVPWLSIALMTPSLLLWGFTSPHGLSRRLPDRRGTGARPHAGRTAHRGRGRQPGRAALETATFGAPGRHRPAGQHGHARLQDALTRNTAAIRTRRARCQHDKGLERPVARIRHHGRVAGRGSAVLCRRSRRPAPAPGLESLARWTVASCPALALLFEPSPPAPAHGAR